MEMLLQIHQGDVEIELHSIVEAQSLFATCGTLVEGKRGF
mgnify:CR=1 FL=1